MSNKKILKTEMRNPNTKNIDRMSTSQMLECIQKENENAVFYKTFPARERYLKSGSSKRLANCLQKPYFDKISELKKELKNKCQNKTTPICI